MTHREQSTEVLVHQEGPIRGKGELGQICYMESKYRPCAEVLATMPECLLCVS
jgi:hypothetical protein